MRHLRIGWSVLRTQIKSVAHFRANLLAWILYGPLQIGIIFLLWKIIYQQTSQVGEFRFHDMVLYYLLVYFLRRVLEPVQTVNFEVWTEINKGKLDSYLARPMSFGTFMAGKALATPLIEVAMGVPFFLAFALLMGLPVQTDPLTLTAFASSVLGAFLILFLIQFIIGSLTFWMERIFGLRDMIFSVFILFSGQLIPLSVLPSWVGEVSRYLPFQYVYYVPAQIYRGVGAVPISEVLLHQLAWIAGLSSLAAVLWGRGVARYASQGG